MKKIIYALLISSPALSLLHAQPYPTFSGLLPQKVTAADISLKTVDISTLTEEQRKQFDQHLRTIMKDASGFIQEYWDTVKDLISESGCGSNINHYIKVLKSLHTKLNKIIAKNDAYSKNSVHQVHQQMVEITQTMLHDLSDIINITQSLLANKKLYRSKGSKNPSAIKLCKALEKKLSKYTGKKYLYLKKIAYLWQLTIETGHIGAVDSLAQTIRNIHEYYQNNRKIFSKECMIVAIQHKLKKSK